jgi:hypothetical protein
LTALALRRFSIHEFTKSITPENDLFDEGKHNRLFARAKNAIAHAITRSHDLDSRSATKANADKNTPSSALLIYFPVEHLEGIEERNWRIDVGEKNCNCGRTSEDHKTHEEHVFVSVSEERVVRVPCCDFEGTART